MRPREIWRKAIRRGIGKGYIRLAGVDVTYRWHDVTTNTRKTAELRMVRKGRMNKYKAAEQGVMVDSDETYTITQDKFVIDGAVRVPTTRDQIVDGLIVYTVTAFNQDNIEATWDLSCMRVSWDRASAGQIIRE